MTGLYFALIILLHIPAIKSCIGTEVSHVLVEKIGTKVNIGSINLGFLNRVIIDDILIYDQNGQKLLTSSRASVKIDLIPLLEGRISISSAQLFGATIKAYKLTAESKPNYQFILDSLASKESTQKSELNFRIGSLIIRNGQLKYDQKDIKATPNKLDLKHLNVSDISAHIILNELTNDSLNLAIKKLSFKDACGLNLVSLSLKLEANRQQAHLRNFNLQLPGTKLYIKEGIASYSFESDELQLPSLQYSLTLEPSIIRPADLSFIIPELRNFKNKIDLSLAVSGTSTSTRITNLQVSGRSIYLSANGSISNWQSKARWIADINSLTMQADGIKFISENLGHRMNIPIEITRVGNIKFKGSIGGDGKDIALKGALYTDNGAAKLTVGLHKNSFNGRIETSGINLGKIIDNAQLGIIAAKLDASGKAETGNLKIKANGKIDRLDYNQYSYHNININGIIQKQNNQMSFNGKLNINDPNGKLQLNGDFSNIGRYPKMNLTASIVKFNPHALKLTSKYPSTTFSLDVKANISGRNLNTANGIIVLNNFKMSSPNNNYELKELKLEAGQEDHKHVVTLQSDFAQMQLVGHYSYATLPNSIANIIASKLPTLPGLPHMKPTKDNEFVLQGEINKSDWLQKLFGVSLDLEQPAKLFVSVNDHQRQMNLKAILPSFTYDGNHFEQGFISLSSPSDTLKANIRAHKISENGKGIYWDIQAKAADNKLNSVLTWNNLNGKKIYGSLDTETNFFKKEGHDAAHINVHSSKIFIDGTTWTVQPSDIIYQAKDLTIDHFAITHGDEHIIIGGRATPYLKDSVTTELKNVDIAYILNLVNFHSVEFSGKATGKANIAAAFGKLSASAKLEVNDFRFEEGRMGTLFADAKWNEKEGQIDIDALAKDTTSNLLTNILTPIETKITGYISPRKDYIELNIGANGTRVEFLKTFCSSFIDRADVFANGNIQVAGPLSNINLTGDVTANGSLHLSALNTTYTLKDVHIHAIPNEIHLVNDTVSDRDGHLGIVNGVLYHQHLTKMSYDIHIAANNLLAYDTHSFGDNTFYGTAYATGKCDIRGKSGEVTIDVNATANEGSQIVYNAASPTAITKQEFIHWNDRDSLIMRALHPKEQRQEAPEADIPSDMHINFLVNVTPDATLKLIMDPSSGDYIALNGSGGLRATYYNKGNFDLYGNYLIDHGIYKLTIQNAIKKDFQFIPGGTISFGGDPYAAALKLKAQYTVQGVSLSDLNLGRSFSNNNIRVNCLMDITGTPASPKIDFGLDLPTVNNDAKQMILSLINSEEEMNQQVIYLLAIGRFYMQGNNNAAAETGQSQTSLAMQSLLSGTVSQQINNVLSNVVNNSNWNFGANISTGDEGWNNAEYEGILSGRLLNNRLLFNGQFGYRDNANATTSFIGDFDLRYLLFPNGNFAIRMYNQTNDRYFTHNSLNTQGIGLILKKDFNNLKDLFRRERNKIIINETNNHKQP